ncbi:hypothetical protein EG68_01081 [Paragonimus skrjabini miyazakii]|uniref:DUF4537 domain-containing protein n=1 Tax=Paragonimus skrjabini miyazakii TaxID=59628 RepID=A0A8S9ZCB4_9TREM|nr:hypothetical protein EG68_01081 [Paragonimus skrjabini miyazakii]
MYDSNISDMEARPPKHAAPSDFSLPRQHANCLVVHANTTGGSSPAVCCRSDCHYNCGMAAKNYTQYLSTSRANSEPAEYSRFRASRSFLHGQTDLDWYTDNPELAPSASALLLGRLVLAPNQDDGGNMYLGTVLAQVGKAMFLVNFGRVNQPKHSELIQEVSTCDLLSYIDLYRHSVSHGDYVLVPKSKLKTGGPETIRTDHFLDPFLLARVIDGQETRLTNKVIRTNNKHLTIELIADRSRFCLGPNTALWIPEPFAQRLLESKQETCKNKKQYRTISPQSLFQSTDAIPLHPCSSLPPFAKGGLISNPLPATYSREDIENMSHTFTKSEGTQDNCESQEELRAMNTPTSSFRSHSPCYKDDKLEANRIYRKVRDASTLVDKDLTFGRMWVKWRRDIDNNRKNESSFQRPEWKYWGSKSIPNLFKPTYHEPYQDVPVWGRSDRTVCLGEFSKPHTHFLKIVQNSRPRIDYRDSTQVHLALRDPSLDRDIKPTNAGRCLQSPVNMTQPPMAYKPSNLKARSCDYDARYWSAKDSAGQAMWDYHRERALTKMEQTAQHNGDILFVRNAQHSRSAIQSHSN